MENKWWKTIKSQLKIGYYIILMLLMTIAGAIIIKACNEEKPETKEIKIEDTPIVIESVMPKGDLYVGSAIIEDYVVERKTERRFFLVKKEHTCIQIVKQKCSYKIDLDKIKYDVKAGNIVLVTMPQLEYTATTQDTPFMSDDEEYWAKEMPSTNNLKKEVEKKIKNRFDTSENRRKSMLYAEEAVKELLRKLGYEAEFIPHLEQKKN